VNPREHNDKSTEAGKADKGKGRWQLFPLGDHPGIYRRGDPKKGRYVVIVRAGKGRQFKRTCSTLAEALRVQAELRLSPPAAKGHNKGSMPFTKYALEWVATYSGAKRGRKIREQTRLDFESSLKRKEFTEAFGGVKLADVTQDHLDDYAHILEKGGRKPPTVRNCFLPVKLCLANAQRKGHIAINPAASYIAGAAKSDDGRIVRSLDEAELAAIRACVGRSGNKTLILLIDFLWQTGLRIGEALALDPCHIDLARQTVSVERRIYKGSFASPKSKYGTRSVPLSVEMAGRLRNHLRSIKQNEPVFQSQAGNRVSYSGASRWFRDAKVGATVKRVDDAGVEREEPLEWATLHTLRHTCASLLLRREENGGLGLNAREAQHWLGHHSVAFTMDTYATFFDDDLPSADGFDEVVARMEKKARMKKKAARTLHVVEPD
jgi:integrase